MSSKQFELQVFRHLWGVNEDWNTFFPKIKKMGFYSGIETGLIWFEDEEKKRFKEMLLKYDLKYISMIFTSGESVEEHIQSFEKQIEEAMPYGPIFFNSHSGHDSFTFEESCEFFEKALQIEKKIGVPICHETHRGRIMYNPYVTRDLLKKFPELKLCCDFSHWVTVCERLLKEKKDMEIIDLCAQRALHIHARVGFEEGPQVNDPRAPENQVYVEAHEQWWDLIWKYQKQNGSPKVSTMTPEFGPAGYMHLQPYTKMPVVDLEEICDFQAKRQLQRFAEFQSKEQ